MSGESDAALARHAVDEVRALSKEYRQSHVLVSQALRRVEKRLEEMSTVENKRVEAIYSLLWKVAGGVVALLVTIVLGLIGVVWGLVVH